MSEDTPVLEPEEGADVSRWAESTNTGDVESDPEPKTEEAENEADSPPAEEENLEETIDAEEGEEVEGDDAEAEEPDPEPDAEYGDKVKARIDELTTRFKDSDRANEGLAADNAAKDARIAELELQVAGDPQNQEPFKTLADFNYDEAAHQQYLAQEIGARSEAAAKLFSSRQRSEAHAQEAAERFAAAEDKFAEKVESYRDAVYADNLKISAPMAELIRSVAVGDDGPELAFMLSQQPDEAKRIAQLSPLHTAWEMAKFHTQMKAEKVVLKPKTVSKAPAPPPKLKPGKGKLSTDPKDMSDKQFAAWRRKQIANR